MNPHTLSVSIDAGGVVLEAACSAPVGAACRLGCVQAGCGRDDGWPHYEADGSQHPLGDLGYCNETTWLNEESPTDCYGGDGSAPLADGMSITVWWEGDTYVWQAADTAAAEADQAAEIETYRQRLIMPDMTAAGFADLLPEHLRPAYWRQKIGEYCATQDIDPDAAGGAA